MGASEYHPASCPGKEKKLKLWSNDWLIVAGAYLGFCSMNQLGVFLVPLNGMLVRRFPQQFAGTHLYFWAERRTVSVKFLTQEYNTAPWPGLEPGPLDLGTSALTMRPPGK